jgi:hypothetical protein
VRVLIRVLREKKYGAKHHVWAGALLAIFLIWFIHGIVDIPYFKNDFAAWWWVIVALSLRFGYTKIS